ncbi:hypothetical protein [Streptomyces sp. NPDC026659]|uniref:hypothetical protein n=1 Tax=Streptomyces sp. NPDC026659 TaxID=3155123 RepID=UPI0033E56F4C
MCGTGPDLRAAPAAASPGSQADTRLALARTGEAVDAVVLAGAGLRRIGREAEATEVLDVDLVSPDNWPCRPGSPTRPPARSRPRRGADQPRRERGSRRLPAHLRRHRAPQNPQNRTAPHAPLSRYRTRCPRRPA